MKKSVFLQRGTLPPAPLTQGILNAHRHLHLSVFDVDELKVNYLHLQFNSLVNHPPSLNFSRTWISFDCIYNYGSILLRIGSRHGCGGDTPRDRILPERRRLCFRI